MRNNDKWPHTWFTPDGPITNGKLKETANGPDGMLPAIGLGGVVMGLSGV